MEYRHGTMRILVTEDYAAMSRTCAELIATQVQSKPNSVLGLATGSTPIGTYQELIRMHKESGLDFSAVTTFNLDEYYPIQKSNDQSYDYFMKEQLFNHINIDFARLNIPNGEASDIAEECAAYEANIKAAGGIDFQILGIGLNGHIGFNEPDDSFAARTHQVTLDDSTIEANARFFASKDEVPKQAITMGIGTIMAAKTVLLMINGAKKAAIAKQTIFGDITPRVPASVLQLHQNVIVALDADAAVELGL